MRDLGGLNETDIGQGAGGVDGPPLGVGAAHLASRPVVPLVMMMTTGGISGWRARMACQVSSSVVSARLAPSEYSPGMPTSALGGAVGPGLLWAVAWGLFRRGGGRCS